MRVIKFLFGLLTAVLVALLGLAFIIHNQAVVAVNLLTMNTLQAPVYVWIIGSFGLGGMLGLVFSGFLIFKEKAARQRLEKRLQNTSKLIAGYSS
jgi:uncharacterized integral membrane protein